jgi:hypothetical protein
VQGATPRGMEIPQDSGDTLIALLPLSWEGKGGILQCWPARAGAWVPESRWAMMRSVSWSYEAGFAPSPLG